MLTPKRIVATAALLVTLALVAPYAASEPVKVSKPPQRPEPTLESTAASEPFLAILDELPLLTTTTTTTVPPTTTTTAPPAPEPESEPQQPAAPASAPSGGGDPNDPASWERLAGCETGYTYDWATNTGNGYYGGLQFSLSSWQAVGGTGYPHEASKAEQIRRGQLLWQQGGWHHWPGCSREFGWI